MNGVKQLLNPVFEQRPQPIADEAIKAVQSTMEQMEQRLTEAAGVDVSVKIARGAKAKLFVVQVMTVGFPHRGLEPQRNQASEPNEFIYTDKGSQFAVQAAGSDLTEAYRSVLKWLCTRKNEQWDTTATSSGATTPLTPG